jgi:hypothetical protein
VTYDEAIEFFARYGGISSNPERLKRSKPTYPQLRGSVFHAKICGQEQKANEAMSAVLDYYESIRSPIGEV